ncbi:MAG: substrate-binding domain-containing protein [Alphaproteobacteria bacterium]
MKERIWLRNTALAVGVLAFGLAGAVGTADAQDKKYRFLVVSHMGPNDSNSKWFDLSLSAFEEKFPDAEAEYISTSEYNTQKYIQLIEQAVATDPDGLAVAITEPAALEGAINKAIEKGIPVVAFNISDSRPQPEKIDYLTYIGGDEYRTGLHAGQHALGQAQAGKVPQPTKVLCANPDPAHAGLAGRCRGMTDAMAEAGIETETLITDQDPARASNILGSYLQSNEDVNFIYTVTGDSGPVVWRVADELGLSPDVDMDGVTIIGVDANPISLTGVADGRLLSTHSQGFWLQGFEAASWLYWFNKFGYKPAGDILTGPVIVDASTADSWIGFIKGVFGDEAWDQQAAAW